jgi:hypothetical protein
MSAREPTLKPIPIKELRPTQITVGMREVELMRKRWRERTAREETEFLGRHLIPVVLGPKERHYVIDHHHLCLALHEEGMTNVLVTVLANLSMLDHDAFWTYLDNRAWVHPFDHRGKRCSYQTIPTAITKLTDDPFRSLAGELRRSGGFAKDTTPFSEFLWADFLRRRVDKSLVKKHFKRALGEARALAKTKDADYLPGWCGSSDD